jgi:ATP-dependent DNA ligase
VKYCVFDSPSYDAVFTTGEINGVNCKVSVRLDACLDAIGRVLHQARNFTDVIELFDSMQWNDTVAPVTQYKAKDWATVSEYCDLILSLRGEGVMVRHPGSYWCPNRSSLILKIKPYQDAEGFVVGWEPGEGKYTGMLGALVIQWGKVQFALSGFTDVERALNADGPVEFRIGEAVTFKYRELTDGGIPKEARYYRKVVT